MFYHYRPNSLYNELHDDADVLKGDKNNTTAMDVLDSSSNELVPLHMRKMSVTPVE